MPTVPIAQRTQTLNPLPASRQSNTTARSLSADAFGAGLGRAADQIGDLTDQRVAEQMRLDNEARAMEIDNQFRAELNDLLSNPQTGYYQARGRAAYFGYNDVQKKVGELRRKHLNGTNNQAVQAMLQRSINSRADSALQDIGGHAGRERRSWLSTTYKLNSESNLNDGVSNYNNEKLRRQSLQAGISAIRNQASMEGIDPTLLEESYRSQFHTAVIEAMMVHSPDQAEQYYKDHEKEILGETQTKVRKALEASTAKEREQSIVEEAIGRNKGNYRQAISWVRKNYKGKDEDGAIARLKARQSEFEHNLDRGRSEAYKAAQSLLAGDQGKEIRVFEDLPLRLRDAMGGDHQLAIKKAIADRFKPGKKRDDIGVWRKITGQLEDGEITPKQAEEAITVANDAGLIKDATAKTLIAGFRGEDDVSETDLKGLYDLYHSGSWKDNQEDYLAFNTRMRQWAKQSGRGDYEALRPQAALLAQKGTVPGMFFASTVTRREALDTNRINEFQPNIPDNEVGMVDQSRQYLGLTVNTADRADYYARWYQQAQSFLNRINEPADPLAIAAYVAMLQKGAAPTRSNFAIALRAAAKDVQSNRPVGSGE